MPWYPMKSDVRRRVEGLLTQAMTHGLENRVTVTLNDIARAYVLCAVLRRIKPIEQTAKIVRSAIGVDVRFRHMSDEVKRLVYEELKSVYEKYGTDVESAIDDFLIECLRKYIWLRYYAATPLAHPYAMLALIANPPQSIGYNGIRWGAWTFYFMPRVTAKTIHRPLLAKVYFTYTRQLVSVLKSVPKDKVLKVINEMIGRDTVALHYEKHYAHYTSRQGQGRGSCNAFRELVKWLLNATALVFWYYAVNLEHRTLPDIPYILAKDPSHADTMYPPLFFVSKRYSGLIRELCPGIENITWRWLMEQWRRQVQVTVTVQAQSTSPVSTVTATSTVTTDNNSHGGSGRISWLKVAKLLLTYVKDDGTCMVCGEGAIPPGSKNKPTVKTLSAVYRHFKEKHPDIHYEARRRALEST